MKNNKIFYRCSHCSYETLQWLGRCPSCGSWNTFQKQEMPDKRSIEQKKLTKSFAQKLSQIKYKNKDYRYKSGIIEFDRPLGGGIVPGSIILLGGEPGIGKSTLVLQVADKIAKNVGNTLYVAAEESISQIYIRAKRLSVKSEQLYLLSETNLDQIIYQIKTLSPKIAIIDSIQIINDNSIPSAPGSINQIKNCTLRLMEIAKKNNIVIIIIGHVTKGGVIAGPKIMEHMVDTVLYLEGEKFNSFRLLRGIKNRFGTTNELGIFQMENEGLKEVNNPSEVLISSRSQPVPGAITSVTFEGSRPLVIEIEALVSSSFLNNPRRITTGIDSNRVSLIIAVLENRLGIQFQNKDVYVNAVGGIKINEPAIDLSIAFAITSSLKGSTIDLDTFVFGELGLTGELRSVGMCQRRLSEAQKIGYKKAIIPFENARQLNFATDNLEVTSIKNINEINDFMRGK